MGDTTSNAIFSDERKLTYLNVAAADHPLTSPVSDATIAAARRYRKARMVEQVVAHDCDALLLYDPVNIRYVMNVSNMTIWMMHNAFHYALICADGTAIDFAYGGSEHLAANLEAVDESRTAITWTFQDTMDRGVSDERAKFWATEIADPIATHGARHRRIAIDTCVPTGVTGTTASTQSVMSWTALTSNGGATITGYTVTANPGGQTCSWTSGALSCTVTGLTNGTPHTFTVTATNTAGLSSASTASSAVTPSGGTI